MTMGSRIIIRGAGYQVELGPMLQNRFVRNIPERCFTRVGSGLTYNHYTRLKRLAKDKHSSLL